MCLQHVLHVCRHCMCPPTNLPSNHAPPRQHLLYVGWSKHLDSRLLYVNLGFLVGVYTVSRTVGIGLCAGLCLASILRHRRSTLGFPCNILLSVFRTTSSSSAPLILFDKTRQANCFSGNSPCWKVFKTISGHLLVIKALQAYFLSLYFQAQALKSTRCLREQDTLPFRIATMIWISMYAAHNLRKKKSALQHLSPAKITYHYWRRGRGCIDPQSRHDWHPLVTGWRQTVGRFLA